MPSRRRTALVEEYLSTGLAEVRYHEVGTRTHTLSLDGSRIIEDAGYATRSAGYAMRRWTGGTCRTSHVPAGGPAVDDGHAHRATAPWLPSTVAAFAGPTVTPRDWVEATDGIRSRAPSLGTIGAYQSICLRWTAIHTELSNTAGATVTQSTNLVSLETTTRVGSRVVVGSHLQRRLDGVLDRLWDQAATGLSAVTANRRDGGGHAPGWTVADEEFAGLLAHEVVGHPLEADVVAGLPGTHWSRDTRPVARPCVTVVDDPRDHPYGPWDHEGTPVGAVTLLDRGLVGGRLHTVESASAAQAQPTGHARAVSWRHRPIPRMSTTGFVGSGNVADLLEQAGPEVLLVYGARGGRALADGTFWAVSQGATRYRRGRRSEIGPVLIRGESAGLLAAIRAVSAPGALLGGGEGGCGKAGQFPFDAATRSGAILLDASVPLRPLWS